MAKLIFLLIVAIGGFYAYEHYFGEKTPPPRLSAPGTVYNLARTNASGDGKLMGIPAGSELRLIAAQDGYSTVEYRGLQFELPETFLTRDLDAVDQIRVDARRLPPTPKENQATARPAAPPPKPEVARIERSLQALRDKRKDLEHRMNRLSFRRSEKGDFDGLTDLRAAEAELRKQIERLAIEEQRLRELHHRETR